MGVVAAVVVVLGAAYYFLPMMQATAPAEEGAPTNAGSQTEDPSVQGTWRSQTDAKFTREMRQDGVIIDRYEGDPTPGINGSWEVVDPRSATGLIVPVASLAGMTVIKASWENDSVVTYFAVNAISETAMTITDLSGNGEVTTFTRI